MKLRAPAKVNLSLRVTGKREDGFHEIDSLMVPLTLADELEIDLRDDGEIQIDCDTPGVPTGPENLVAVAAQAFFDFTGSRHGVRVKLEKRIPHGAGLGGGSSDAAATLVALNALCKTELSVGDLEAIASRVGSDVAFFIRCEPARATGRGEIIQPATWPEGTPILLLKPAFAISTPWAYQSLAAARSEPRMRGAGEPIPFADTELVNDLEVPVFRKYVSLAALKSWLVAQPESRAALMSGSGSTVFALCDDPTACAALGERALAEVDPSLWMWAGATAVGRGPLAADGF